MPRYAPALFLAAAFLSAPMAHAAGAPVAAPPARAAVPIAEPDTLMLFLIGASGLLIGRRLARDPAKSTPRE